MVDNYRPKTKNINLMLLDGGLGDHVASTVAIDYIIKRHPWITPLIWVPDYYVDFCKHLLRSHDVEIFGYSRMRSRYNPNYPTKTTKWDGIISPMKIPLVDYGFLKLADENPDITCKNYLQIDPNQITQNYVNITNYDMTNYVVITTGYTADVREFRAEEVNKVSKWLISQGITPVFLGATQTKTGGVHTIKGVFKEEIDYSQGVNLIDKTSLLEAAKIMHGAKAVIGVDNGLLHVAACTQVPIVGGFTTVTPECRVPIRNGILGHRFYIIVPEQSLKCRFCQVNTNFLYGHDYRNCLYKGQPQALECTKQMTAEQFIKGINSVLAFYTSHPK